MNCYSLDLREKAIKHYEQNKSLRKTAKIFNISRTSLLSWIKIQKEHGTPKAIPPKSRPSKVPTMELVEYIEKKPTATLKQIAERFKCSITQAYRRLRQINVSHKKNGAGFYRKERN